MRTSKDHVFRACYIKGVSHLYHLCFGRDLKAGRGVGKLHSEKGGRLQMCSDWRLLARRFRRAKKQGILCDCLGIDIYLSLVGPKLEAGTKVREAIRY